MNMKITYQSLVLAVFAVSATTAQAQQRPPVRKIGAVSAKTAETFANVSGVRSLSDGSVLVNDLPNRRVLLFNPQLSSFTVVADSTSATDNAYGGRTGSLVAYRGDSSIFIDPASVSMLVIDPKGKVARVMAIPRADDAMILGSGLGNPVFDGSGRLIYRASAGFGMRGIRAGGNSVRITQGPPGGAAGGRPPAMAPPEIPDSAFIVSVDLATRKVDTLGYIRTPKTKFEINQDANGGMRMQSMNNPLPVVDDWSVLPDGSIAFVRGKDYHIDWVTKDGVKTSSSKIPFNWQRMTEEDKVEFLDSLKAARARLGPNAPVPGAPGMASPGQAAQVMVFSQTMGGGGGGAQPAPTRTMAPTEPTYVPASDLPDYKPAFFAGSTIADSEGNLWIRTIPTEAIPGGPVYDVINRKGELVERVQIPENRTVVGFGTGGAVYMLNREGATATLEKASIR
jgi:hypothetical protein